MKRAKQNKTAHAKTSRYYNKEMIEKLSGLGCAFNVQPPALSPDPELCLIESLKFYWEYNDIFFMFYSLLKNRIGGLIHVERLASLAKKALNNSDERALLIALCGKLAKQGDRRFSLVFRKLCYKGLKMRSPPKSESSARLIKLWGKEDCLAPFGARVRAFYETDEKKLLPLKQICDRNRWIKWRAIAGPNYRADILYLKSEGIAKTAYRAGKIAGCNISTAVRIWKALKPVSDLKKLAV